MISYTVLTVILTMTAAYIQAAATPLMEAPQLLPRQAPPPPTSNPLTLDPDKVPPSCRAACTPLLGLADGSCSTNACACTAAISTAFIRCVQCGFTFVGPAFFGDQAQGTYDQYSAICRAAGLPVPSFTFAAPTPGVAPAAPTPAVSNRPAAGGNNVPAPGGGNNPTPSSGNNRVPGSGNSPAPSSNSGPATTDGADADASASASDSGSSRRSESRMGRAGPFVVGALSTFFFFAV